MTKLSDKISNLKNYLRNHDSAGYSKSDLTIVTIAIISVVCAYIAYESQLFLNQWNVWLSLGLPLLASIVLGLQRPPRLISLPRWATLSICVVVALATILSMSTMQNLQEILISLGTNWVSTSIVLLVSAVVINHSLKRLVCATGPTEKTVRFVFTNLLTVAFIYLFSRRTDSLFQESSSLHWSYFVGPVQSVRSGGLLLWDTVSQYGYLTVLIPSSLPVSSAWDAFYWFQVAVLFIAASMYYISLVYFVRLHNFLSGALVIGTFFLSYPPLIGPSPYPSSSAVRFLACYALLALACYTFLFGRSSMRKWTYLGTAIWIGSFFWSSEGFIYASAIFWSPIVLQIAVSFFQRETKIELDPVIVLPLAALPVSVGVFTAIYHKMKGEYPDLDLIYIHSKGYSAGFGSLEIPLQGPFWVYVIIIVLGALSLRSTLHNYKRTNGPSSAIVAAVSCVLIISTYYFGRAASSNVIAQFGLVTFCALIILRASNGNRDTSAPLRSAILPILVVGLVAPYWNENFSSVALATLKRQVDVVNKLSVADSELIQALDTAGVTIDDPVVYYGFDALMPAIVINGRIKTFEKTWLPVPLQLLEDPISNSSKQLIIERAYARHPDRGGYLIWKRGDAVGKFEAWKMLLSRFYEISPLVESPSYAIYLCQPKDGSKLSVVR